MRGIPFIHQISFLAIIFCSLESFCQHGTVSQYVAPDLFTLDIYFPPAYDSTRAHKVIYFNDGESLINFRNVFDSLNQEENIHPFLVVGIHAGSKRLDKYLPYDDPWIKNNWGDYNPFAAAYSEVLIQGVIPYVDATFNTVKSADGRALFGYSLGGLQATWLGLKRPDIFSLVGAFSPSYWVSDYQIFTEDFPINKDQELWFDIGTEEWNYYIPMIDHLDTLGWDLGENLFYLEAPNGKHDFVSWKHRIKYPILLFCQEENSNQEIEKVTLQINCIPSQSKPGVVFKRVTPLVTRADGLKYTDFRSIEYEIIKGQGEINEDGSFISNDAFKVSYKLLGKEGSKKIDCR